MFCHFIMTNDISLFCYCNELGFAYKPDECAYKAIMHEIHFEH